MAPGVPPGPSLSAMSSVSINEVAGLECVSDVPGPDPRGTES